jgi:ubiquinone/menaquinone biosynthesis C-methylase UbiE
MGSQDQSVREAFNKQAHKYANWSHAKNVKNLNGYFDFCKIRPSDRLLDIACGPGDFIINAAPKIKIGRGVDISDAQIEIANHQAKEFGLLNVEFDRGSAEALPYADGSFSVVVCRYAFHHFAQPGAVLSEMIRSCEVGGKIGLLDIASYKDSYVNDFFGTFDKLVDTSHYSTLSEFEFNQLYGNFAMEKIREITIDVELNVSEYMEQALQDSSCKAKLKDLLLSGQQDKAISKFMFIKEGELVFKRHVYLMLAGKVAA